MVYDLFTERTQSPQKNKHDDESSKENSISHLYSKGGEPLISLYSTKLTQ